MEQATGRGDARLTGQERACLTRYQPLLCAIDGKMKEQERVIVAIDGPCASGKTTLAALLARIYGCNVFHMDDFFLRPEQRTPQRYAQPGGNVDRERFAQQVLEPLLEGRTVCAQRLDCRTMTLVSMPPAPCTPLTVVEGSYCLHPALRDAYTLSVFLRIDPRTQAERILRRNGAQGLERFETRWIPLERAYHAAYAPERACSFVFDADALPEDACGVSGEA